MDKSLDAIKNFVKKAIMKPIARGLNSVSGGRITPSQVTIFGLLAHLPIAYLIARGKFDIAAVLLVIFGLFDALDGELARLQKNDSSFGMFLDSVTDRMKEIFLYAGICYFLASDAHAYYAVWAVLALGGSMLTSYMNAWGEAVLKKHGNSGDSVNQAFRSGLLRFEVRMFLLVVALLTGRLDVFVVFVAVFAWLTALQRLGKIARKLR